MDDPRSQLTSALTTLDELTQRLVEVADAHRDTEREDITFDLDEVERSLRGATRRLQRLVRRLD
ncbi:hypothetical protein [Actinomarinicola tropica]|uniref:Uncharacterized protein n=1 Tax=Actinomarinicola tropica TaxID=2789776 RepID=A0A5Q2RI83_9ACTN|nr:hypothetical protein [Actinomarinicola tropica]QGG95513.1 hypothetical protein GH723_10620 [Actinomarinicola tropica]